MRIEPLDIPIGNCRYHAYCDACEEDSFLTDSQTFKYGLDETVLVTSLAEALCSGPHDEPRARGFCYSLGMSRTTGTHLYFACNPSKVDCGRVKKSETAILISGSGYTGDDEFDKRIVPLEKVWRVVGEGGKYSVVFLPDFLDSVAHGLEAKPRRPQARITKPNRNTIANARHVAIAGLLQACIEAARRCEHFSGHYNPPSAVEICGALKDRPEETSVRTVRRELKRARDLYRRKFVQREALPQQTPADSVLLIVGGMLEEWADRIGKDNARSRKGKEMREAQLIQKAQDSFSVQLMRNGSYSFGGVAQVADS